MTKLFSRRSIYREELEKLDEDIWIFDILEFEDIPIELA
jgi:hypothetical protein